LIIALLLGLWLLVFDIRKFLTLGRITNE
jgi:hypothetical protein